MNNYMSGKIINFTDVNKDIQFNGEDFDWLVDRMIEYISFLKRASKEEDKQMWCEKLCNVLKFLGDYRLEYDLKNK